MGGLGFNSYRGTLTRSCCPSWRDVIQALCQKFRCPSECWVAIPGTSTENCMDLFWNRMQLNICYILYYCKLFRTEFRFFCISLSNVQHSIIYATICHECHTINAKFSVLYGNGLLFVSIMFQCETSIFCLWQGHKELFTLSPLFAVSTTAETHTFIIWFYWNSECSLMVRWHLPI